MSREQRDESSNKCTGQSFRETPPHTCTPQHLHVIRVAHTSEEMQKNFCFSFDRHKTNGNSCVGSPLSQLVEKVKDLHGVSLKARIVELEP